MIWSIKWTKSAFKTLEKLSTTDQRRIMKKLDKVKLSPDDFTTSLTNRNELKMRIGDIRLFIELDKGNLIILVIKIGDRKNIYKR